MAGQGPTRGRYAAFAARGIDFSKETTPTRLPKNVPNPELEQTRKSDAESLRKQLEEEREKVANLEELLERSRAETESVRQALTSDVATAKEDAENARTQAFANAKALEEGRNERQQLYEELKRKSVEIEEMSFDYKLIENLASLITTHLESFADELSKSEEMQLDTEHRATVDDILIAQDGMFVWRSLNSALHKKFCEAPMRTEEFIASSSEARKKTEVLEQRVETLEDDLEVRRAELEAVNNITKVRRKQFEDMKQKVECFLREVVLDSLHKHTIVRDSLSETLVFLCRGERGGLRLNELADGFRNARTVLLSLADNYRIDHLHEQIRDLPKTGAGALSLHIDSIIFAYQSSEEEARRTGFRLTRAAVDAAVVAQLDALQTGLAAILRMNLPEKDNQIFLDNMERIVEAHRRLPEPKRHDITDMQPPHTWPSVQIPNLSNFVRNKLIISDADRVVGITHDTISLRKTDGQLEFWKLSKN